MSESRSNGRRDSRRRRQAVVFLVIGSLLGLFGLPLSTAALSAIHQANLVEQAVPQVSPWKHANLTVNLTDQPAFVPRFLPKLPLTINASTNVTVRLVNQGQLNHTFTLSKVPNILLNTSWSPSQLDKWFSQNGSLANVSVGPGASASVNVSFNSSTGSDSFEFVSVVPYQFQAGMWGLVNITGGPGLALFDNASSSALQFVPNQLEANTSHFPTTLDVRVGNLGSVSHTWTIAGQPNVTLLPSNFTSYFAKHAPLASPSIPATPGGSVWANFSVPAPGVYEYICQVSGHFAAGMYGFLYVDVSPPTPPSPPSTAIVQVSILVGSAVILGIGALLAAVASFTGRFPQTKGGSSHP